jgi:branched-chain amino acid transport system permease protein
MVIEVKTLTIIIVNALVYTAILSLIAVGLNLILGVLRILNLAHGIVMALGAYLALSLTTLALERVGSIGSSLLQGALIVIALFLSGLLGGLLFAVMIGYLMVRKLVYYEAMYVLLITYSIALVMEDVIKFIWGPKGYVIYGIYPLFGTVEIAGITYPGYYFILLATAFIVIASTYIFVDYTSIGKIVKAVASDRETAVMLGVRADMAYFIAFAIGCMLTGIGGAFTAPLLTLQPGFSLEFLLLAFIVVVITGLGEIRGIPIVAFIISLLRAITVTYVPELEMAIPFLLMMLVLAFRPQGLFGGR